MIADLSVGHATFFPETTHDILAPVPYASRFGSTELRDLAARHHAVSVDEVFISTGASLAISSIFASLADKRRILLPRPGYPAYAKAASLFGHEVAYYEMNGVGHPLAIGRAGSLLGPDSVFVANFPHNPTGQTATSAQWLEMARICQMTGSEMVADLAYEPFQNIGALPCHFPSSVIRVYSLSKSHGLAGLRIGYVIATAERIAGIASAHWTLAMSAPACGQAAAMVLNERWAECAELAKKHRAAAEGIVKEVWQREFVAPEAGIFLWIDVTDCGVDGSQFAELCVRAGVAVTSGLEFGARNHIRVNVAVPMEALENGMRIVVEVGKRLRDRTAP